MSFLNVDRTHFEKSLLINEDSGDGGDSVDSLIENYVNNKKQEIQTVRVVPIPGFCVKTHTQKGEKVFINVCHTAELPRPKGLRVPMSIGNEREITDKAGQPCIAYDVAVNSEFFDTMKGQNEIMIGTVIDAVAEKHGLELETIRYHIVKNIKSKGKIGPMVIEKRSIKEDIPKKPLICEIESKKKDSERPKAAEFNLIKVKSPNEYYASEIDLLNVFSKDDIRLEIGEDRLFLTTKGKVKYELEYHFPQYIDVDYCSAEFDEDSQVLTVLAPLRK